MLRVNLDALRAIDNIIYEAFSTSSCVQQQIMSLIDYDFSLPGIKRVSFVDYERNVFHLCFSKNQVYLRSINPSLQEGVRRVNCRFRMANYYRNLFTKE